MESVKEFEKLAPFARKARIILVGRSTLYHSKSRLGFVLVTRDLTENSLEEIRREYSHYPIVRCLTMEDLERILGVTGTKVVGFVKGPLAKGLYQALKSYRINKPESGSNSAAYGA